MPRRNHIKKHTLYVGPPTDCSPKRKYRSAEQAQSAADLSMLQQPQLLLDIYQCDICRQWHLTSRKTNH